MTAPVRPFPSCHHSRTDPDTGRGETSFENDFGGRGFKFEAYQRTYPDRVRAYFRATGLRPAEIAVAYGVTERTAQNWLEGLVGASGHVLSLIALRDREGFERHFDPRRAA